MTGIVLQTQAIAIRNHGGGYKTTTSREEIDGPVAVKKTYLKHSITKNRQSGSDYVIFKCPGCGHRNNQCVHNHIYSDEQYLAFKCTMCRRQIEVFKPTPKIPLIVDPKDLPVNVKPDQNKIIRPGISA